MLVAEYNTRYCHSSKKNFEFEHSRRVSILKERNRERGIREREREKVCVYVCVCEERGREREKKKKRSKNEEKVINGKGKNISKIYVKLT